MQNYSHQGPTMLNLPHDIITAVPGQEHGRTQDSKGPPNHGCVSMPALYRTRAPASDYELTQTKCCAWQHQGRGGPRNALGYRPDPEVLPLPAETSREAPKCCAWQQRGGAPKRARVPPLPAETSREAPKCCACCPCQQKRAARLPSAAPGRGGPETRSGTVQSLKRCPCQQKRAARLPSAAPGSIKGGGPETRSGTVQSLKCCPCQQKRAARLPSAAPGRAPKRARAPSRA